MKFTHLHVHSHFSLLDGLAKIDQLLDKAKECGMESLALTDHGVMYGAVEFYKKAKERGIKPIIGCELYEAVGRMDQKRPGIDDKRYHLILLAKNEKGYKNLVNLVTKAHLEGFYYKPRIDQELLKEHAEGLIALSACLQGKVPQMYLAKRDKEAQEAAEIYQKIFGKDNFYLEIQNHPNNKDQILVNKKIIALAKKTAIPLVATNDIHYLNSEDAEAQDVLMLINTGADKNNPERLSLKGDDLSMTHPQKMKDFCKEVPEAFKNTEKIARACNFDFDLGKIKLPYFKVPEKETADSYLKKLCEEGIKKKYEKAGKEIKERLSYELSVISKLGFSSYFLIVQDFVNWAKEQRIIIGPGRGSAGGSIVSYLLNITNVDPMKYQLIFERFLNPGRTGSLPDIDLDITDRRREEVINYVAQKYGRDKVSQIITFGTMASRVVIRDVGRALQYPYDFCDKLAKMIPFGFSLSRSLKEVKEIQEIYQSNDQAKTIIDFGKKLEGVARHASTHACGVVISKLPLTEHIPLQYPTQGDDSIVTQYDMYAVESLGLLKMDLLGLKNLTIIEDTLSRIYVVQGKKIEIDNIPENDKKTFDLFRRVETTGIFQLESDGMKRYLKELEPTRFEDIDAMIALYRPGPMELIPTYIKRKHGKEEIRYVHPKLKPILENTYGIILYQEQLMQIAQQLAGFSLEEADILRKAVGKKIKELLNSLEKKFIDGAIDNQIPKEVAKKIWEWILPFASYGFNRAHSCAYAKIAYQTAYLKAHFPVEFMAALLTSEKTNTERIAFLIQECEKMKVEVLPPSVNESLKNFTVVPEKRQIRFGLLAIKNVGENIAEIIAKERKRGGQFTSIADFAQRIGSKNMNKKSLESLIKAGALDDLGERNLFLHNIEKILEYAREKTKLKENGQTGLFDQEKDFNNKIILEEVEVSKKAERLKWEKELLGLYVSANPLDDLKGLLEKKCFPIKRITHLMLNRTVTMGGIIDSVKKINTKKGDAMLFVKFQDLSEKIEVICFPKLTAQSHDSLQEGKIVFLKGKISKRNGDLQIIAEGIEEIINKE